MGAEKARITLPDGRPLLTATVEALRASGMDVVVVSDVAGRYEDLELPSREVVDVVSGRGPMGGLHAGLLATETTFAFVAACDMPFIKPEVVGYMAGLQRDYEALVPRVAGRWQPAFAVYARATVPLIERLLADGENSLTGLLSRLEVRGLDEDELRRVDPELVSLTNLNEPQDLRRTGAASSPGSKQRPPSRRP